MAELVAAMLSGVPDAKRFDGDAFKLEGLILTVLNKAIKFSKDKKAAARSLYLKYRTTIDHFSQQRVLRFSRNSMLHLLLAGLNSFEPF